jgi:phosphohistidine swiveling domain-containing protein
VRDGKRKKEDAAERLAKNYGWMPVLAFGSRWQAQHYVEAIDDLAETDSEALRRDLAALERYSELRDSEFSVAVSTYGISAADQQPFIDFGLAMDARNEAEYMNSFCGAYLMDLYKEIAERLVMEINQLRKLSEREVSAALRGLLDAKAAYEAKGRVVAWFVGPTKERIDYSGERGEELFTFIQEQRPELITATESNRGITANKGKARGTVRLVLSPEHNDKVRSGDILFAYSTMVDNLPAMKKAAAFVTESGGLTCHAAVVAREFGVPCIVSYKNAMSDFKDGELVEVDADAGTVRKV